MKWIPSLIKECRRRRKNESRKRKKIDIKNLSRLRKIGWERKTWQFCDASKGVKRNIFWQSSRPILNFPLRKMIRNLLLRICKPAAFHLSWKKMFIRRIIFGHELNLQRLYFFIRHWMKWKNVIVEKRKSRVKEKKKRDNKNYLGWEK